MEKTSLKQQELLWYMMAEWVSVAFIHQSCAETGADLRMLYKIFDVLFMQILWNESLLKKLWVKKKTCQNKVEFSVSQEIKGNALLYAEKEISRVNDLLFYHIQILL